MKESAFQGPFRHNVKWVLSLPLKNKNQTISHVNQVNSLAATFKDDTSLQANILHIMWGQVNNT